MTQVAFIHPENRTLDIIVTGTGRSGTGFAAKWLSSIGIPVGHEAFFDYRGYAVALQRLQMRDDSLVGDSAWAAAPYLGSQPLENALVIHQVRHPRKVAESCMRQPPHRQYREYMEWHEPRLSKYSDELNRAICRWVYWNQKIENQLCGRASFFWRIEDGTDKLWRFLIRCGMVDTERITPIMMFANQLYNRHPGPEAEARFENIAPELVKPLQDLMERYRYFSW